MKNNRWKQKMILYAVIILIVIGVTIPAIRYYLAKKAEKEWLSQEPYFTEYHFHV